MSNRTRIAVERQITAMGADVFEVGLFKPRMPGDGSKEPEMLPRVWDRDTLLRSVGWLCFVSVRESPASDNNSGLTASNSMFGIRPARASSCAGAIRRVA
jgi:hypothetical protein